MRYLPKTLLGYPFRRVEIRFPDQSSCLGYEVLTPNERILLVPEMHGGSLYYAVIPRGRPTRIKGYRWFTDHDGYPKTWR